MNLVKEQETNDCNKIERLRRGYEFESYGVDEYWDDFYVKGNTYSELVANIENSREKEIGFSINYWYRRGLL